jgi:hypothetical protein
MLYIRKIARLIDVGSLAHQYATPANIAATVPEIHFLKLQDAASVEILEMP